MCAGHAFILVILLLSNAIGQNIEIKKERRIDQFDNIEKQYFVPEIDNAPITKSSPSSVLPIDSYIDPYEYDPQFIDVDDLTKKVYHHIAKVGAIGGGSVVKLFEAGGTVSFKSEHKFKNKYLRNFYYDIDGGYDGGYCNYVGNKVFHYGIIDLDAGYCGDVVDVRVPIFYKLDNYPDENDKYFNRFKTGINVKVKKEKYWNPDISIRYKTVHINDTLDHIVKVGLSLSRHDNLPFFNFISKDQTISIAGKIIHDRLKASSSKNDVFIALHCSDKLNVTKNFSMTPKAVMNIDAGNNERMVGGCPFAVYPGLDINWRILENLSFVINMNNGFVYYSYYDVTKRFYKLDKVSPVQNIADRLNTDVRIEYTLNSQFKTYCGTELHWYDNVPIKNDDKKVKYDIAQKNSCWFSPFIGCSVNFLENRLEFKNRLKLNIVMKGTKSALEPLVTNKLTTRYTLDKRLEFHGTLELGWFDAIFGASNNSFKLNSSLKAHYNINDMFCVFVDFNDILAVISAWQGLDNFGQQRALTVKAGVMLRE